MPMDAHEIERRIKAALPDANIEIRDLAGDGDHYAATVISEAFRGKSRVQQHQLVYSALQGDGVTMPGLRESLDLIRMVRPEAGTAAIEHEIAAERANSIGAAEARVIKTLKALSDNPTNRDAALGDAQQAVWAYFVQRELIGFRRHADVIRDLQIPGEVLAGLGAVRK
jgi:acid stress-induced BolA-like protein IbaG/YrbA